MEKFYNEKRRLKDYLQRKGISVLKSGKLRCPNPSHADLKPTAKLYDKQDIPYVHCPVCEESWSVIDIAGMLDSLTEFNDILKSVRETLSISDDEIPEPIEIKKTEKQEKNPLSFTREKALVIYNRKAIEEIAQKKKWGDITGSWKYHDKDGLVNALDVRFEGNEKKEVITFWYDGVLKWYGPPVFIYNLHKRNEEKKPFIIHEGAKCVEIGESSLPAFHHLSWSGGSGKAGKPDWSFLENEDVYILYDDDQKKYPEDHPDPELVGKIKPLKLQPGYMAAQKIKKQLPNSKIIKPVLEAREIKPDGADIEEILRVLTPEKFVRHIKNKKNIESIDGGSIEPIKKPSTEKPTTKPATTTKTIDPPSIDSMSIPVPVAYAKETPFKILGIGDDGKAAFITEEKRLQKYPLDSINKNKLTVLTGLTFWRNEYASVDGKVLWDDAVNDIIRITQRRDFDESLVRGRGAWRDGEKLSYHNGVETIGEWEPKKIYLRLPKQDIGLKDSPASPEIRKKIKETVFKLSFQTPTDAVRCLAWSVLAPFAGALEYRPAILLTGPSGSGKTTVSNLCIRKLANCEWFNGSESTVAGVRGKIKFDSRGAMFEESEKDTVKKSTNRDELFSLMRVSVSNDAPDTVKGTKDGGYNSFKMQNMFGFIAIDPTINSIADENRIFRILMVEPKNGDNWKTIEKELVTLLVEKNCRAIRAYTWKNLKLILNLSKKIVDIVREKTVRDYRSSLADAMLISAFIVVWGGNENPSDKQIDSILDKYYSYQTVEEHRNEAEEILDRLLDETIEILDGYREKITIMECLNRIYRKEKPDGITNEGLTEKEITRYRQHVNRYGVRLLDNLDLAIVNNHHLIIKIIGTGKGYNKILSRHPDFVEGQKLVHFSYDGKSKRCTIIKNIFDLLYVPGKNINEKTIEMDFD